MSDDPLDAARRTLYRLPPEQFLDARAALVEQTDDAGLAAAIGKLRKPTQAAWIVNAYATDEVVDELIDLGRRLASAQAELRTTTLRELTLQRRELVARLTKDALAGAGRDDAGATLRDSVRGTFDAAVADPEIAGQLGMLQQPQTWSGFGAVAPAALTVVGGRTQQKSAPAAKARRAPEPESEEQPDDSAERDALATARQELDDAEAAEQDLQSRLKRLTTKLTTLQHDIAAVRHELDEAKHRTTAARRDKRRAQSALDRHTR